MQRATVAASVPEDTSGSVRTLSRSPVRTLATFDTWTWCAWFLCVTWFRVTFSEHETRIFIAGLAVGAGVAALIAAICPPCALVAGIIAAVLALTATIVELIDAIGDYHGIYFEGYIPGTTWMWHN